MEAQCTDLLLPTLDGAPLSLAHYRGQKVLLMDFASCPCASPPARTDSPRAQRTRTSFRVATSRPARSRHR